MGNGVFMVFEGKYMENYTLWNLIVQPIRLIEQKSHILNYNWGSLMARPEPERASGTSFKVKSHFVAKSLSSVSFGGRKIVFRFYEPQETQAGLLLSF
jgi:hypothetical protein